MSHEIIKKYFFFWSTLSLSFVSSGVGESVTERENNPKCKQKTKKQDSPEHTTRSFPSGAMLPEVVFASKSSFYPAIH